MDRNVSRPFPSARSSSLVTYVSFRADPEVCAFRREVWNGYRTSMERLLYALFYVTEQIAVHGWRITFVVGMDHLEDDTL